MHRVAMARTGGQIAANQTRRLGQLLLTVKLLGLDQQGYRLFLLCPLQGTALLTIGRNAHGVILSANFATVTLFKFGAPPYHAAKIL